jgi:hypothetical protein
MLIEGQARAYEVYFDMDSSRSPIEIPKGFISEYETLLDTYGLKETLGLRVWRTTDDRPGGRTMEYSASRWERRSRPIIQITAKCE